MVNKNNLPIITTINRLFAIRHAANPSFSIIYLIFSLFLYIYLGYFIQREQIWQLLGGYILLLLNYLYLIRSGISAYYSFIFRLVLLFSFPVLSDDFYRFVFDGRLLSNGINPYLILPSKFIKSADYQVFINDITVFNKLNSPNYYTVYPPLNQFIFGCASSWSNQSLLLNVIILRLFIIVAEFGSIWLISKLNSQYKFGAIYAFNPLIILELTGNLHFEAVMLFFGLLTVYLFIQKKYWLSAICLAFGVSIKLLPLIFIPLIIKELGFKKGIIYSFIVGLVNLILFAPFFDNQLIQNVASSVGLYFQKFEFNASIYYIIRQIGYWIWGYNIIGDAGKGLALLVFSLILWISIKPQSKLFSIPNKVLFILTIYYFFATTVHPWYISTLIMAMVFTPFRYPVAWSLMVFLTYFSYTTKPYEENLYLVFTEYLLVFGMMILEIKEIKR
jgi:alpha-1,6-mannosyltransferase